MLPNFDHDLLCQLRSEALEAECFALGDLLQVLRDPQNAGIFYVYCICDEGGVPFYIGKGLGDRVAAHELEAGNSANVTAKHVAIRETWDRSCSPVYKLLNVFIDEHEAFGCEKQLIRAFGRRDEGTGILTNRSNGGEGKVRDYATESWDVDDDGIVTAKTSESPSLNDLLSPRFRHPGRDVFEETKNPTGQEMQKLAFWQEGGLTVQVFLSYPGDLKEHIAESRERQKWYGGPLEITTMFRVFDGKRLIIEDRATCHPRVIEQGNEVVAVILWRLSAMPEPIHGHVRFDRRSVKDYTKKLRSWICNNEAILQRYAVQILQTLPPLPPPPLCEDNDSVIAPPVSDREAWEIHQLTKEVLIANNLRPLLAERMEMADKAGIILLHWLRSAQATTTELFAALASGSLRFDWTKSTISDRELRIKWDSQFPSHSLASIRCLPIRAAILSAARTLRDCDEETR